ncbi:MAG: hypothetical protein NTV04_10410 [Deltaproteobacteria bacterium]|nr:hypothetical protein [Deltaproteobacteria bacterium]
MLIPPSPGRTTDYLVSGQARNINEASKEYASALSKGRLLMLSPFGEKIKRADEDTARIRNEFVAALASRVFVAHAAWGGKTERFCEKILGWGKPLLTFGDPGNAGLINLGARPLSSLEGIASELT